MAATVGEQRRYNRQGESSRRKILAATMRIAAQEGHRAATISRITEETGVSASSIFWHFRNKKELVALALEDGRSRLIEQAPTWDHDSEGVDCLERLVTNMSWWPEGAQATAYWRVGLTLALEGSPEDEGLMVSFIDSRRVTRERIRRWWGHELSLLQPHPFSIDERASDLADLTVAALDGMYIAQALGSAMTSSATRKLCLGLLAIAQESEHERRAAAVAPKLDLEGSEAMAPRDKLIRATSAVIAKYGFHGATIARICTKAGLPASSLYWSFKDKDALVAAVISEGHAARYGSSLAVSLPAQSKNWSVDFAQSVAGHLAWTEEYPQATRLGQLLALQQGIDGGQGRATFANRRLDFNRSVSSWLEQHVASVGVGVGVAGAGTDDLAILTIILIDGFFLASRLGSVLGAPEVLADWVTGILIGAIDGDTRGSVMISSRAQS